MVLDFLYKVAFAASRYMPRWWFFRVVTPLYNVTFERNVVARIPKRRKLARLFWCVDGGLRWVTINLRGKAPRGFDEFKQRTIKDPSDEYLARLEAAVPKLQAKGYIVQRVHPLFHPDSPGGWCAF